MLSSMKSFLQSKQAAKQKESNHTAVVPSIIGRDLTVEGNIKSTGDVQVNGRIKGDVRAQRLVVGEDAQVKGNLFSEEAIVHGHVTGDIYAGKVQLFANSHVEGNILHQTISIELGAYFEGDCHHPRTTASKKEVLKVVPT